MVFPNYESFLTEFFSRDPSPDKRSFYYKLFQKLVKDGKNQNQAVKDMLIQPLQDTYPTTHGKKPFYPRTEIMFDMLVSTFESILQTQTRPTKKRVENLFQDYKKSLEFLRNTIMDAQRLHNAYGKEKREDKDVFLMKEIRNTLDRIRTELTKTNLDKMKREFYKNQKNYNKVEKKVKDRQQDEIEFPFELDPNEMMDDDDFTQFM